MLRARVSLKRFIDRHSGHHAFTAGASTVSLSLVFRYVQAWKITTEVFRFNVIEHNVKVCSACDNHRFIFMCRNKKQLKAARCLQDEGTSRATTWSYFQVFNTRFCATIWKLGKKSTGLHPTSTTTTTTTTHALHLNYHCITNKKIHLNKISRRVSIWCQTAASGD